MTPDEIQAARNQTLHMFLSKSEPLTDEDISNLRSNRRKTATRNWIARKGCIRGGAQGIELAVKVARRNHTGSQIACFEGGYHGRSAFTSQLSASHRYRHAIGDWRIPVFRLPYPDCDQCRFSQTRPSCHLECVSYLRQTLSSEVAGLAGVRDDVIAFLVEPILNAGGIVIPDPAYLEAAVEEFQSAGAIIIVDETFCGWYRTGPEFGFMRYNIKLDIVVLGKALTNGIVPLISCVWARDPLMLPSVFPPGTHSATYVNNVFSMAIANSVLDRYEDADGLREIVCALEFRLGEILRYIAGKFSIVNSVHVVGGAARLLLTSNAASAVLDAAREAGAADRVDGFSGLLLARSLTA